MSDLQPSRFPPSPDVSHAQTTQWSADEQSDEESSPKEWGDEDFGVGKQRFILWWQWRDARFEGTLPLALSARIPLEIFEFVIDAIEDQSTLPVVALVCAMWYPRAMHNLYYAVEIRSRTSFNRLYKQCYASPRVKQWLANTCQLRAYGSTRYMGFLQALPSALAGLMPRVRLLDIRFGRLSFIHTGFFFALSDFKSVKSLTLRFCELNNISQLRRIVSAFPELTDLTIIDVEIRSPQDAASYAGASLFQSPSHIRLRYLNIGDLLHHEEVMVIFLNWMARSGLCKSLADLKFHTSHPSMTVIPLNKLLEAAGASLTRYRETHLDNYNRVHGNLLQNNTLRSWDFTLQTIEHMAKDTGPSTVWAEVTDELHGIFSTIRSHQLEHIKVRVRLFFDDNFLAHKESSLILEKLDLRDLHEVMSGPYFDTLKDVEVEFFRDVHHDVNVDIRQKLKRIFRGILQPWSARGVVTVTWVRAEYN